MKRLIIDLQMCPLWIWRSKDLTRKFPDCENQSGTPTHLIKIFYLNSGHNKVVQSKSALLRIKLDENIVDKSGTEPVSHLLQCLVRKSKESNRIESNRIELN